MEVDGVDVHAHWGVVPSYSIWVPETLTVTLPSTALLSNNTVVAAPQLVIWAEPGKLSLHGKLVETNFETTIKLGATTLELRLEGDRWVPEVAHIECDACPADKSLPGSEGGRLRVMTPPTPAHGCPCVAGDPSARYVEHHRNASFELLDALHATGTRSERGSWNHVMRPLLNDRTARTPSLWRVDDFTLNLTLPQLLSYDIESPETLHLTAPRRSVLSDQPLEMPSLVVYPLSGGVIVNGSLLHGVDENLMRSRSPGDYLYLEIHLNNETWVEEVRRLHGIPSVPDRGLSLRPGSSD